MKKVFLFLGIASILFYSCNKNIVNSPAPIPQQNFVKGADISWVTEMEAAGKKFYNKSGVEEDCFSILKTIGINTIRLRVWVNPSTIWNNSADVVAKAIRAKNAGLRVLIDFHYSDTWADPGQQAKPSAWVVNTINELETLLYNHTASVLGALKANGVSPDWVQIGNETNDGMLWPEGKASSNMANFIRFINSGYDAVKGVFPKAKVIVHLSKGFDNALYRWMFDALKSGGAKWDVIGMSLYPSVTNWSSLNNQCLTNMNDMVGRYGKEIMIVEVGMPWDSPDVCKNFITDLITKVKSLPNGFGLGVVYWEPEAYNNWNGYSLGAFDNSGKPTIGLDAFN